MKSDAQLAYSFSCFMRCFVAFCIVSGIIWLSLGVKSQKREEVDAQQQVRGLKLN